MEIVEAAYTVNLCDYPGLPDADKHKAEHRYARVLERQLGGAEQVSESLRCIERLEDTPPEEITEEAKAVFQRWMKAARAAAEAGMQGLGDGESCFFEVRHNRYR
jgi:hypothetical protein